MDKSHEEDEKTLERPLPAEPPTEELGRAQGQATRDDADAHVRPHLSDVTGITGSYLRASFDDLLAACKRHKGGAWPLGPSSWPASSYWPPPPSTPETSPGRTLWRRTRGPA